MDLDRHVARASPIHAADPRLKFVLALAFIVAVSLLPVGAYAALALAWFALVVMAMVARLGAFRTTRAAFIALPFMLVALPLVFTRQGDPLVTVPFGPWSPTVSGQGLREFTTIAIKSWVSVQAALLLSFTTPFHDLVDGLRQLRLPRIMVAIIGFMYRYLGVMAGEAARMMRARTARSAYRDRRSGGTLRWRASVAGHLVGSLFLRSYERSERIYGAMQARGFDGEFRYLPGPPITARAATVFGLLLIGLVLFEVAAHVWLPAE